MMHYLLYLLLLSSHVIAEDTLDLLILHTNDMHARFEETSRNSGTCSQPGTGSCVGGFARVAEVVKSARKAALEGRGRQVLFLNAGDTFTGTVWFGVHKTRIAVDFMNLLLPDAMCLGNHEFDLGAQGVHDFISGIKFPVVAANLDFSQQDVFNGTTVPKSVVLGVAGHKIGVIGYLTPTTKEISLTQEVKLTDEIQAVKEESEKLDAQGVKIIIALGHSGFQKDKELARKVPLVDLVIGGHTNTFLWNGAAPSTEEPEGPYPYLVTQTSGKVVPVVQAYAYTKYIGRLNVTFDASGALTAYSGQPLLLDNATPQNTEILETLEAYRPAVEALDTEVVGKSRVFLDGDAKSCRFQECNFGNLITDAFVAYRASVVASTYWTDAPIALFNGGAVRGSINASEFGGNITRGELLGALPFGNQVITLSLNGSDLVKTLELAARSDGETSHGEFLQVSGLKVEYDYDRPSMSRVVSVKARCADCTVPSYSEVVENATYRLVTTGFLTGGGDGHYVLQYSSFNRVIEDLDDISVVEWYIGKRSPVYPEVFGRIQVNGTRSDAGDEENGASSPIYSIGAQTLLGLIVLNILR